MFSAVKYRFIMDCICGTEGFAQLGRHETELLGEIILTAEISQELKLCTLRNLDARLVQPPTDLMLGVVVSLKF